MNDDQLLPLDREGIRELILAQIRIQRSVGFDSAEGERLGLQMEQNIQDRLDLMTEEDQRTFETLYVEESKAIVRDIQAPPKFTEKEEKERDSAKFLLIIIIIFVVIMFLTILN
ncbi:hypothetical protein [Salinicola acroporae]|uniref:Uncharacterized protein n=1 Tax=Salinicola acroporae TaxID=1541440 RepID=A0ABT6I4S5_9GAMM|nr:hypothetical protein [Salinicola acroporae]MDH4572473.1 hypothetical protein [Salinicola acroporae]